MQITPHIHAIKTPLGPSPDRFVHVYIVYGDNITLIDTGFSGSDKLIIEDIRSTGRDTSEIGLIILTHSHPDHTGSAKAIRDLTGCKVAAHPLDAPAIENVDPMLLKSPSPGVPPLVSGSVPIDRLLNDGDKISLGKGLTLEVLYTPGHTPGSISLLLREEMALFTGDAVQAPGRPPSTQTRPRWCDRYRGLRKFKVSSTIFQHTMCPPKGLQHTSVLKTHSTTYDTFILR